VMLVEQASLPASDLKNLRNYPDDIERLISTPRAF